MLDEQRERMLNIAMLLTADELDRIHDGDDIERFAKENEDAIVDAGADVEFETDSVSEAETVADSDRSGSPAFDGTSLTAGERERLRTRESKVSTTCVGQPREAHEWWPVGTALEGRIGNEIFDASVVSNPRVKSGRSILIDSGPAHGRVCLTPTRAAIEATEEYRRMANLGRGGGVANGWGFWKPKK